jgi:hypothetical protein
MRQSPIRGVELMHAFAKVSLTYVPWQLKGKLRPKFGKLCWLHELTGHPAQPALPHPKFALEPLLGRLRMLGKARDSSRAARLHHSLRNRPAKETYGLSNLQLPEGLKLEFLTLCIYG